MRGQERGFTLIELVVVITLIGILAAVALPKFIDVQGDARVAVMEGVTSSMHGAAALVYAKSMINGVESATSSSVSTNAGNIETEFGYPAQDQIIQLLSLQGDDFTTTAGTGIVQYQGNANCQVQYMSPTAAGYSIVPDFSDC